MKTLALIPARMGSSRFPGKPLANILGKPMIEHVYERVSNSRSVDFVAVATCDTAIFDFIQSIGGTAVMTSDRHERASDRCAEALLALEAQMGANFDIVVMVQGDEPMTEPAMIDEAVKPMQSDKTIGVVNLVAKIASEHEFRDPNTIKVVCDCEGNALAFSRQPIPTVAAGVSELMLKQVCIIPFRRERLLGFANLEPTPLEIAESVDMMRFIEHGYQVRMIPTSYSTHAVDAPSDIAVVEELMQRG